MPLRHLTDRFSFAVLAISLVLAAGCSKSTSADSGPQKGGGRGGGGDVPVTLTKVSTRDVPVELQVIGNVEAYSTITVRAQVTGEVTKVFFKDGDYVKAGQMLFTIDRRPIDAELAQGQAMLLRLMAAQKVAEANLARDSAQATYVRSQAARYQKLQKEGIISKEQADQFVTQADVSEQTLAADRAAIDSAKADIEATKATFENSKVKLTYTEIRSPINGRTGNVMAKQGNLVNASSQDLVTINQVEPIYVTFSVPEAQLPAIKNYMAQGKLQVTTKTQDDSSTETGVLTFVDNAVDATTGTIKLKGTFTNSDLKLWPGQFVRVTLRLTTQKNALVLPNQAVQTGQDGPYVYVVKEDKTVENRKIVTGMRMDQDLVIERGLEAGDTVVLDGQLRLAPGMKVQVRDPNGNRPGGKRKTT
ncbi:MAG: efflux RND transporter periplasmic adaptor subunit [Bryobacteraceae bacterium]